MIRMHADSIDNIWGCCAEKQQFEREMLCMIKNHQSFPCIVQWIIFNEGWGQYEVRISLSAYAVEYSITAILDTLCSNCLQ